MADLLERLSQVLGSTSMMRLRFVGASARAMEPKQPVTADRFMAIAPTFVATATSRQPMPLRITDTKQVAAVR